MKKLIFYFVLTLFAGMTYAQEITELGEARVGFAPLSSDVSVDGENFSYTVNESYAGEFEKDPLLFMTNNFDVRNFIAEVKGKNTEPFLVTFRSSRGSLMADFNSDGEVVKSYARFKNVLLPKNLRHQLYRDHQGWKMVKNLHLTLGRDGMVNQEIYKIKLAKINGKERKTVIMEAPLKGWEVAGN